MGRGEQGKRKRWKYGGRGEGRESAECRLAGCIRGCRNKKKGKEKEERGRVVSFPSSGGKKEKKKKKMVLGGRERKTNWLFERLTGRWLSERVNKGGEKKKGKEGCVVPTHRVQVKREKMEERERREKKRRGNR